MNTNGTAAPAPEATNIWLGRPVVIRSYPLARARGQPVHRIDGLCARIEGTIVDVYVHGGDVWFKVRANPSHGEGEGWVRSKLCDVP